MTKRVEPTPLPEEIPLESLQKHFRKAWSPPLPGNKQLDLPEFRSAEKAERALNSGHCVKNGKSGDNNGNWAEEGKSSVVKDSPHKVENTEPLMGESFNDAAEQSGKRAAAEVLNSRDMHGRSLVITEPEEDEETGERAAYMAGVLAEYQRTLVERTKYHLGYPYNLDFDYGALSQLQHFSINNLGDPFIESNYGVHSREFEVGVLDWFARLWDLQERDYWGYITNCGTEGNLHGILVGREVLPDGILYASCDSHYSVFKAARMYRMDCIPVATLTSGEIDCADFGRLLEANRARPAIVNVNIGTTVKGAVDDLDLVIRTLEERGFPHDRFYIHCDGALFGLMIPFVKRAPRVSFQKPIGSVSVSGHKFVGCPMPCGVQITRKEHVDKLSRSVEYLASRDATIMGSRNGHAPLFLWYTLNRKGYRGFQKEVHRCLRNAHYLKGCLQAAGFGAMLNDLSSTVVFERPPEEAFVRKWQLACQGKIAHAVVMPSVSQEKLDLFVAELIESRARCVAEGQHAAPCIADEIGPQNCACPEHRAPNGDARGGPPTPGRLGNESGRDVVAQCAVKSAESQKLAERLQGYS